MFNNRILAHIVAAIHLIMIGVNTVAIPMVILYEPFYIWMPIITFLVSPFLGGVYCIFNRLENDFRRKAGMREITDRIDDLIMKIRGEISWVE